MATIGTLHANLVLESAAFISGLNRSADAMTRTASQIEQQTSTISRGFNSAAGALKSFAVGLVGTLSVGTVANMAKETFAWADALQELGDRVGFSVQKLQELQQAGDLTNVSQQQIITNLEQFGRRLGEAASGSGELAKVLEANNIALRNSDGSLRSVSEVFDQYVTLIANAETQQEALSLAVDGFGRSGAGFVTTIKEMNKNVGQFNVLTDEQVATLAKYDDKITKTTELLNFGFRAALAEIISSTETDIQNLVAVWDSIKGAIQGVSDAFITMRDDALGAVEQMVSGIEQALGQRMKKVAQASAGTTIGIALQWKKVYDAVVGQSYVPDMMDGIEREFKRLPAIAVAPTKAATAAVDSEFARLADRQQQHVQAAIQNGTALPAATDADFERVLTTPFSNALQDVQAEFTSTFEQISLGTIRSFEDMAQAGQNIFANMASNLASLAIFDPQGFKALAAQSGVSPGALGAAAFATPAVGLLSGLFGNQGSQRGVQYGGAGGAALGGLVGLAFGPGGAAVGSIAGGLLGSIGGGILGGLFGGGKGNGGTTVGGHGRLGASFGSGAAGQAIASIDQALLDMLNSRQTALVNRVLASRHFSGRVRDEQVASFAASKRVGGAAQALGFNAGAITRGSAEQQLQNLKTALDTRRAIEDLTGSVTAFDRQVEGLEDQFADLNDAARRFGISTAGLAEAQKRAAEDLRKTQDASVAALFDPFEALSAPLEALAKEFEFASLAPAQQFAKAQEEFQRIAAEAEAGSLPAIQQFEAAARLFTELAGQVGASPGQAAAMSQVQNAIDRIGDGIARSQAEAGQGVEGTIERASRNEIDTLNELRDSIVEALRKLESTVRNAR